MSNLTDSEAVFTERAREVGLDNATVALLTNQGNQGINNLSKLAFSVGQPGDTPTEASIRGLVADGGDPAAIQIGVVASLRRLIFESQTLMISQVKAMVESREDDAKTELAPAERTDRIRRQKDRLRGMELVGELECGYSCYDLVLKMMQSNAVQYLQPHKFVSRKMEIGHEKPTKQIVLDSSSHLTVKEKDGQFSCDTGSDLLLKEALTRRALAMDLVGAASFHVVEAYNRFLISQLQETQIAGYSKISIQQILRADREAFLRLAEMTPDGIKRTATGNFRPQSCPVPVATTWAPSNPNSYTNQPRRHCQQAWAIRWWRKWSAEQGQGKAQMESSKEHAR